MKAFKYICLGIILGVGLAWGWFYYTADKDETLQSMPAMSGVTKLQAPFDIIYNFYHALNTGEEEQLPLLVTPEFLEHLNSKRNTYKWYWHRQEDPSVRFVFFLITEQELDLKSGFARVKGSAEWVSNTKGAFSFPQTIIILNNQGLWRIKSIEDTM